MTTLFDFIMNQGEASTVEALPAPAIAAGATQIATRESLGNTLISLVPSFGVVPEKDVAEFSNGIAKLVTEDEFLKELSETIHQPTKGETEDDFVKRCNRALFALIDERLNINHGG